MPSDALNPPTNLSHLEKLIDKWSKEADGVAPGRTRRLVGVSVLAELLKDLERESSPLLMFKGGASLEMRFGPGARASRDVDALSTVALDEAFEAIRRCLAQEWCGFNGAMGERTPIVRAGIVPPPERCKIKLKYLGKSFVTLDFELGFADAASVHLEEIVNAIDVSKVQLPSGAEVTVLGVHHQIAQKIHACTERPSEGSNARVHDLYDILLLEPIAREGGLENTRAACQRTFANRGRHVWPPELPEWEDWPTAWAGIDVPAELRFPYQEARERIGRFISDIHES